MILSLTHMADEQDDVTRCLRARRKHNEAHRFLRPCDAKQAPVDEPGASPARVCVADCGISGGMDINSMPAPKYLVATEQRDSWVPLLARGRGPPSAADDPNPPSQKKLGGMLLEALARVDGSEAVVIVIDVVLPGPFWDKIREWARGSDSALPP